MNKSCLSRNLNISLKNYSEQHFKILKQKDWTFHKKDLLTLAKA